MNPDIKQWDYKTHEYKDYKLPNPGNYVLYTEDMTLPINCASCGKHMVFGDGYTSRELHNHVGFGYPVCEDCYEAEREREHEHERRREA